MIQQKQKVAKSKGGRKHICSNRNKKSSFQIRI